MKKVEAIIQPAGLKDFKAALYDLGIHAITVSEVLDHERWPPRRQVYRGTPYQLDLLPKIKVEILVSSELLEDVIDALSRIALTNKTAVSDRLMVFDVAQAVRLRGRRREDLAAAG